MPQRGKKQDVGPTVDASQRSVDAAYRAVTSLPESPQAAAARGVLDQASQGIASFVSLAASLPAAALRKPGQAPASGPASAAQAGRPKQDKTPGPAPQRTDSTASVPVIPGLSPADRGGAKPGAGGGPLFVAGSDQGEEGPAGGRRDPREVIRETSRLLELNPNDAVARADRAQAYADLGDFKAADEDSSKALETDPVSVKALNARAYAANKLGHYDCALQDADQVVKLAPGNALGHLNRAMALEGLGRIDEALREYALAAQLDPSYRTFLADAEAKRDARPFFAAGGRLSLRARAAFGAIALFFVAALVLALRARRKAAAAKAAPALAVGVGTVIGANYRIDRLIGEGGKGKVFEGFDTALRRKVAIKMVRAELRREIGDAQILDEARLAALVRHPNVVEVFAALQEAGELFLVFDFVEGKALSALLPAKRRFSLAEARHILGQVAAGLDCAHGKRVIHRDLKPANVVISMEGVAKLMDFGLAHRSGPAGAAEGAPGAAGTSPYMAPEQHEGAVSPESDLYALGVVAYEMLTGRRPFDGPGQLERKRRAEFVPAASLAPGLAAGVDAALKRALSADPKDRFHSGQEFVDVLPAG